MTYTICQFKERAILVLEGMGDAAKIISEDGDWVMVEITISNSSDILKLIHCGITIGTKPFINHK
jgi:hypothetical protein